MAQLEDPHIQQEEAHNLARELNWLLKVEFPELVKLVEKNLASVSKERIWVTTDEPSTEYLEISALENKNIKGKLLANSCSIKHLEIIAQMPVFNQKHLFQISLSQERTVLLKQAVVAKQHLEAAKKLCESSKSITQKESAFELIQAVLSHFSDYFSCLSQPFLSDVFPNKICDPELISPKLPDDLVAQFYIKDDDIVFELLNIQKTAFSSQDTYRSFSSSLLNRSSSQSELDKFIFAYGDREVEIIDRLTLPVPEPGLTSTRKTVETLHYQLVDFVYKLQLIS